MTEHIESTDVEVVDDLGEDLDQVPTSRRRLFQLGLAGAAVAAGAAAIDGLASSPAAAATGGNLIIGHSNSPTLQTDITILTGPFRATPTGAGTALEGNPASGTGVLGAVGSGNGVEGTTNAGIGVLGIGTISATLTNVGVQGEGNIGVLGEAINTTTIFGTAGVKGTSNGAQIGVLGTSVTGIGVEGTSGTAGFGVNGSAGTNGTGVKGSATSGIGVSGVVPASATLGSTGVQGAGNTGVLGIMNGTSTIGIAGVQGTGLDTFPGLKGVNTTGPALTLQPLSTTTLPSGDVGSFVVLSDGSLHYAYANNAWVQLDNGIVTLPAPVRIIDTTNSTGGITGPLVPGATVHTTSVLTGAHGIPAQAIGLVGNFAISGVGGALLNGFGVATIFPAGVATPATANINAGAGCFAISNSVTVALGTGGSLGKLSIVWNGGGAVPNAQAFFDVTGYIL